MDMLFHNSYESMVDLPSYDHRAASEAGVGFSMNARSERAFFLARRGDARRIRLLVVPLLTCRFFSCKPVCARVASLSDSIKKSLCQLTTCYEI